MPIRRFAFLACLLTALALPAVASAAPIFGFNDDWGPGNVAHTVALSRQFHANSARVEVYWTSVEPRKRVFDWYLLDRAYGVMLARHVRPLLDVVSAPVWVRARGCHDVFRCQQTPAHDGDFRVFVRALTKRYPHAIAIEIGQEPNLNNWSIHPDAARYAQVLKAGYTAVKQVNRRMRVIVGSTCCNTAHGGGNIGAAEFLARLYRYGIKGHYDAIGYHIYPGRVLSLVGPDLRSELYGMRAVRNANGDRSQFWVTETGYPSRGVSPYGGGIFTEANQATRELITYNTLNGISDVRALYLYRLVDPAPKGLFGLSMGIFRANYRPKPAALALKRLTRHRR